MKDTSIKGYLFTGALALANIFSSTSAKAQQSGDCLEDLVQKKLFTTVTQNAKESRSVGTLLDKGNTPWVTTTTAQTPDTLYIDDKISFRNGFPQQFGYLDSNGSWKEQDMFSPARVSIGDQLIFENSQATNARPAIIALAGAPNQVTGGYIRGQNPETGQTTDSNAWTLANFYQSGENIVDLTAELNEEIERNSRLLQDIDNFGNAISEKYDKIQDLMDRLDAKKAKIDYLSQENKDLLEELANQKPGWGVYAGAGGYFDLDNNVAANLRAGAISPGGYDVGLSVTPGIKSNQSSSFTDVNGNYEVDVNTTEDSVQNNVALTFGIPITSSLTLGPKAGLNFTSTNTKITEDVYTNRYGERVLLSGGNVNPNSGQSREMHLLFGVDGKLKITDNLSANAGVTYTNGSTAGTIGVTYTIGGKK